MRGSESRVAVREPHRNPSGGDPRQRPGTPDGVGMVRRHVLEMVAVQQRVPVTSSTLTDDNTLRLRQSRAPGARCLVSGVGPRWLLSGGEPSEDSG